MTNKSRTVIKNVHCSALYIIYENREIKLSFISIILSLISLILSVTLGMSLFILSRPNSIILSGENVTLKRCFSFSRPSEVFSASMRTSMASLARLLVWQVIILLPMVNSLKVSVRINESILKSYEELIRIMPSLTETFSVCCILADMMLLSIKPNHME